MKVERVISWFDKQNESLAGEYNLDNLSLQLLKNIFNPPIEDYLMYNPYTIYSKEAEGLKKYIDFQFDFNRYIYQLDCFQK